MAAGSDIERTRDLDFHHREWRVQGVGRALLALLVVACASGALGGSGPLAGATARSAGGRGLEVEHPRYAREHRSAELRARVAGAPDSATLDLWIETAYLDRFRVEGVTPEPESTFASGGRIRYRFALAAAGEPFEVVFQLTPDAMGRARGRLGVGAEAVELRSFVYP